MNCTSAAILGLSMLGATFATMTVSEEQHAKLRRIFPEDVDAIYDNIIIERRNHYVMGLILGLALAYILVRMIRTTNMFHKISFVVGITSLVAVVFYFLMPKSAYILNYLKTPEQSIAWLDVYKTMKQRYFLGFVIGGLAAIPLAYAMC